jgi:hypothetical protein
MDPLRIDRHVLSCLSAVAGSAVEDLNSGLADGTYEDDDIGGWSSEAIEAAISEADAVLEADPQGPLKLIVVLGEHPFAPYEPMDLFLDDAGAQYRAADLTRSFLKEYWDIKHGDDGEVPMPQVTEHNWVEIVDKYGSDEDFVQQDNWGRWWVTIVPKEVIDA